MVGRSPRLRHCHPRGLMNQCRQLAQRFRSWMITSHLKVPQTVASTSPNPLSVLVASESVAVEAVSEEVAVSR